MPGASSRMGKKSRRNGDIPLGNVHSGDEHLARKDRKLSKSKSRAVSFVDNPGRSLGDVNRSLIPNQTSLASSATLRREQLKSKKTIQISFKEGERLFHQESCITAENGSDRDDSVGIVPRNDGFLHRRGDCNGIVQSVPVKESTSGKRSRETITQEEVDREALSKKQKLEEARVWQYVCKRSVFVSPPRPARDLVESEEPSITSRSASNGKIKKIAPQLSQRGRGGPHATDIHVTSKTSTTKVSVNHNVIDVTLTKESRVVQEWIETRSNKFFGMDLEWQPNRLKGHENKVALLQLSTEKECLLVQMLFLDKVPSALVELLKDPDRIITGVGIRGDTEKLQRDYGLSCGGELELTKLAVSCLKDESLEKVGLKALAKEVLGFNLNKSKAVTMSNWSKSHLTRKQVEYACIDAWISLAIFSRLQNSPVLVA